MVYDCDPPRGTVVPPAGVTEPFAPEDAVIVYVEQVGGSFAPLAHDPGCYSNWNPTSAVITFI
jgi:hypothetical protein